MLSKENRDLVSLIQDPELWFDSLVEKQIYTHFRENFLLPVFQYKIGHYYLDFAFPEIKTAIEFDGPIHLGREKKDERRKKYICNRGWNHITLKVKKENLLIEFRYPGGKKEITESNSLPLEDIIEIISDIIWTAKKSQYKALKSDLL